MHMLLCRHIAHSAHSLRREVPYHSAKRRLSYYPLNNPWHCSKVPVATLVVAIRPAPQSLRTQKPFFFQCANLKVWVVGWHIQSGSKRRVHHPRTWKANSVTQTQYGFLKFICQQVNSPFWFGSCGIPLMVAQQKEWAKVSYGAQ